MRQGFRRMSPSSVAVFRIAFSSRYAFAALVGLAPASRSSLRQRRTCASLMSATARWPKVGALLDPGACVVAERNTAVVRVQPEIVVDLGLGFYQPFLRVDLASEG